jgi:hypothetical protein
MMGEWGNNIPDTARMSRGRFLRERKKMAYLMILLRWVKMCRRNGEERGGEAAALTMLLKTRVNQGVNHVTHWRRLLGGCGE